MSELFNFSSIKIWLKICCRVYKFHCCENRDLWMLSGRVIGKTLTYFQSPISTTAHAPTDIELLERADSSEDTNLKKQCRKPCKIRPKTAITCGKRAFWTLGHMKIARAATQTLSRNLWMILVKCTPYIKIWIYYDISCVLYFNLFCIFKLFNI